MVNFGDFFFQDYSLGRDPLVLFVGLLVRPIKRFHLIPQALHNVLAPSGPSL